MVAGLWILVSLTLISSPSGAGFAVGRIRRSTGGAVAATGSGGFGSDGDHNSHGGAGGGSSGVGSLRDDPQYDDYTGVLERDAHKYIYCSITGLFCLPKNYSR